MNYEYIETYKGNDIIKCKQTGFFKINYLGADFSNINFLKKIIDIKSILL
jgi:hypothetical protein